MSSQTVQARLDSPVFMISIDTELAWGAFDCGGTDLYSEYYEDSRGVVRRLLAMFSRYDIPVTWAIVGHLFLESCSRNGPDSHSHVLQPDYSWYPQGWLSHDPCSDWKRAPYFYAPDIVDLILNDETDHEIGCHTFTHAIIGDSECSREVAMSQLSECRRLAQIKGVKMESLVFPRNSVGHLDVLHELGFTSFRGVEPNWYSGLSEAGVGRRLCHFVDRLLAAPPPCHTEFQGIRGPGGGRFLFNIPASMFLTPLAGLWRIVPVSRRVLQAKRGIERSLGESGLFHLWFHPENISSSPDLEDALEEILRFVSSHIEAGRMTCYTMARLARRLDTLVTEG